MGFIILPIKEISMNIRDIDERLAVIYGKQQDEMDVIKSEDVIKSKDKPKEL